jgi:hypothetical protein
MGEKLATLTALPLRQIQSDSSDEHNSFAFRWHNRYNPPIPSTSSPPVNYRRRAMPTLSAPVAPSVKRSDLEHLQGVWVSVAGPQEARFLIAGNRFSFEFVGGDIYIGTFTLGGGCNMDMHVQEGPLEHKGLVAPCRYELQGGVLRWCTGRIGTDRRPEFFPDVEDDRKLSFVFRHAPRRK